MATYGPCDRLGNPDIELNMGTTGTYSEYVPAVDGTTYALNAAVIGLPRGHKQHIPARDAAVVGGDWDPADWTGRLRGSCDILSSAGTRAPRHLFFHVASMLSFQRQHGVFPVLRASNGHCHTRRATESPHHTFDRLGWIPRTENDLHCLSAASTLPYPWSAAGSSILCQGVLS